MDVPSCVMASGCGVHGPNLCRMASGLLQCLFHSVGSRTHTAHAFTLTLMPYFTLAQCPTFYTPRRKKKVWP
jgi:hypothetical protein